jgi:hypothetical protein
VLFHRYRTHITALEPELLVSTTTTETGNITSFPVSSASRLVTDSTPASNLPPPKNWNTYKCSSPRPPLFPSNTCQLASSNRSAFLVRVPTDCTIAMATMGGWYCFPVFCFFGLLFYIGKGSFRMSMSREREQRFVLSWGITRQNNSFNAVCSQRSFAGENLWFSFWKAERVLLTETLLRQVPEPVQNQSHAG